MFHLRILSLDPFSLLALQTQSTLPRGTLTVKGSLELIPRKLGETVQLLAGIIPRPGRSFSAARLPPQFGHACLQPSAPSHFPSQSLLVRPCTHSFCVECCHFLPGPAGPQARLQNAPILLPPTVTSNHVTCYLPGEDPGDEHFPPTSTSST